jgi:hypothetical protein
MARFIGLSNNMSTYVSSLIAMQPSLHDITFPLPHVDEIVHLLLASRQRRK